MPLSRDDQLIGEQIACLEPGLEEARIIHALTGREYVRTKGGDLNRLGMGQEGSHDHSIVARMHPQIGEGIVMATGEQILFIVHWRCSSASPAPITSAPQSSSQHESLS